MVVSDLTFPDYRQKRYGCKFAFLPFSGTIVNRRCSNVLNTTFVPKSLSMVVDFGTKVTTITNDHRGFGPENVHRFRIRFSRVSKKGILTF